jgi:hypothetical protein
MSILKDASQPLPRLLLRPVDVSGRSGSDGVASKQLRREILRLVEGCSVRERKSEDATGTVAKKTAKGNASSRLESWIHVICAVTENLAFSDTQHFYNLGTCLIFHFFGFIY